MTPQDERVARGMATQLSDRAERGARHLGWKVGFGTAQAMVKLGISAPLVGHLVASAQLDSGATVAIGDWDAPRLEPEVAVHLASDVDAGGGRDAALAALGGLGAAIELVDLDPDADDPEEILSRNIFQRAVLLGPVQDVRDTHGLRLRVLVDDEEAVDTSDITAATGDVFDAVASVAQTLEAAGERLRAGDVVIAGSIVAALELEPGQDVVVELQPLGRLEVAFSA
ncbi:MAG TPA: fumarylacetoacetate hydrolase family protein [Solirubrobacteraceae bacterium]|jgi:2-keto-4-pentenoate hydratase|nr:fumarylacetoacetate hydrolase family protein [Solirubrobacteraceae bacterium]